ncbi:MAG TPA: hypothetical protein VK737_04360 [Opitutales bacterium]|jgi:probable HAF family extracellular repeat protein|nr:hypothetical protein [Opitutales bacterium]
MNLCKSTLTKGLALCVLVFPLGVRAQNATPAAVPSTDGWTLTALGTLGGGNSSAVAINDAGQVVGSADTAEVIPADQQRGRRGGYAKHTNYSHAFLYTDGKMQDLGTLGGNESSAKTINASGQIIGTANSLPYGGWHAFLYTDGKMTTLAGGIAIVIGLNDSGQIVGMRDDIGGGLRQIPFLLSAGKVQDLFDGFKGEKNAFCQINGINNSGMIVGIISTQDNPNLSFAFEDDWHAFLYHPEGWMEFLDFYPSGINAAGEVIGSDTRVAYLYSGGKDHYLGALDADSSIAHAINAAGDVVGEYGRTDINKIPENGSAFLYHNGQMQDLNDLVGKATLAQAKFLRLIEADGINSKGQIVGVGMDLQGHDIAFLLTPPAANNPPLAKTSPAK